MNCFVNGLTKVGNTYNATVFAPSCERCSLITDSVEHSSIEMQPVVSRPGWFSCSFKSSKSITGYLFENEFGRFTDPYARLLKGVDEFGNRPEVPFAAVISEPAPVRGSECYEHHSLRREIFYKLHVRCFTAHPSAGVKHGGTFRGVREKLPYIKKLGVTAVILMPIYDFDETMPDRDFTVPPCATDVKPVEVKASDKEQQRLNVWGYSSPAAYFAVKSSYASEPEKAHLEFRNMVGAFHKAGIDVFMEISFNRGLPYSYISEVLYYWNSVYGVDGFRLMGENPYYPLLASEPFLSGIMLITDRIDTDDNDRCAVLSDRLAVCSDSFMVNCRRLVKGDENQVHEFTGRFMDNGGSSARINYFADHDGFTLSDVFSYDVRHNEANLEKNRDGREINYSWNCGVEGPTGKKNIRQLRLRMCKNALTLMFLSQGVPILMAGDEFLNTAGGNNNYYCCDNETGYVVWENGVYSKDLLGYVRQLIALKRDHIVFSNSLPLRERDYTGNGVPDISFHGTKAWMPDYGYFSRTLGVLLNGSFAMFDKRTHDSSYFILMNLHWESHEFDLPTVGDCGYKLVCASDESSVVLNEKTCTLGERTVAVFEVVAHKTVRRK